MNIPESTTPMPAGEYPAHVVAACLVCEVEPGSLLAWSVRKDGVSIILESGQKVNFAIVGAWHARQMPLPLVVEDYEPAYPEHFPPVGSFDIPVIAEPVEGPKPPTPFPKRKGESKHTRKR